MNTTADLNKQLEQIIADARDPESPHHNEFEWDDARAAHELRTATALHILCRRPQND